MTVIKLTTKIKAPVQHVFDLSRDIDFHMKSASQTSEKAIAGVTTGLIGSGEIVKWKGKHFGVWLTHTSKISNFNPPYFFVDKMIEGKFSSFVHEHHFSQKDGYTLMTDSLSYKVPYRVIGKLFDKLFLKGYLTRFLEHRNAALKSSIESANI